MKARTLTAIAGAALIGLAAGPAAHAQFGAFPRFSTGEAVVAPLNTAYSQFSTHSGALVSPLNARYGQFSTLPGSVVSNEDPEFPQFSITERAVVLSQGGVPASVNTVPAPQAERFVETVPTDPLVRMAQVGGVPVGILTDADPESGIGVARVPGAGNRTVRVGSLVETAAGPAVRAVDAASGVELLALAPPVTNAADPGQLTAAKVVRVSDGAVILDREVEGRRLIEIRPARNVYLPVTGGFAPALTVRRLRPGQEVFISLESGPRGTISISSPTGVGTPALAVSVEQGE